MSNQAIWTTFIVVCLWVMALMAYLMKRSKGNAGRDADTRAVEVAVLSAQIHEQNKRIASLELQVGTLTHKDARPPITNARIFGTSLDEKPGPHGGTIEWMDKGDE